MFRTTSIYYTVYRTTNLINNKIYVGVHRTPNPDDAYLGSGKLLLCAVEKYGDHNFKKEILYICDTAEEMFLKEKELVDLDFIGRSDTYNLAVGGRGHCNPNPEQCRISAIEQFKDPEQRLIRSKVMKITMAKPEHKNSGNNSRWKGENAVKNKKHLSKIMRDFQTNNIITCPVCGVSGQSFNIRKYHFDNCGKIFKQKQHSTPCPWCQWEGDAANYAQHHGDNCKHNPNIKPCSICGKKVSGSSLKRFHEDNCKMRITA